MIIKDIFGEVKTVTDLDAAIVQAEAGVGFSKEAEQSDHGVKYCSDGTTTLLTYWEDILDKLYKLK